MRNRPLWSPSLRLAAILGILWGIDGAIVLIRKGFTGNPLSHLGIVCIALLFTLEARPSTTRWIALTLPAYEAGKSVLILPFMILSALNPMVVTLEPFGIRVGTFYDPLSVALYSAGRFAVFATGFVLVLKDIVDRFGTPND